MHEFRKENPTSFRGPETFDWDAFEQEEKEQLLMERRQKTVLDEKLTRRASHNEQAFSIFQIPIKVFRSV